MDGTIKYVKKVPVWKTILGIITIILSILLFFSIGLFGIVPLGLSLGLLKTEGCEIDLFSKKYREVFSVLGVNIGKWNDLPEIEYVSVFSTTESVTVRAVTAESHRTIGFYKVNLFL